SSERSTWSRLTHDFATAWQAWLGDDERTVWLHANNLGAVEAATSEDGSLVWRASYQPSGQLKVVARDFAYNLRLPGQYEDAETGLFYNGHRYYDPRRGAYLTPDPLGTPDGPNPYAYVGSNPLRYVDPRGLVLFAFDGTENSNPVLNPNVDTLSNVAEFFDLYKDGNSRYISGVGTVDISDPSRPIEAPILDAGVNWSGKARIDRMMEYFQKEADLIEDEVVMNVDIVGFSRGAAQSRDFANRLSIDTTMASGSDSGWYSYTQIGTGAKRCQKLKFRFMGLFDTVLSTNWSGYTYNLAIPSAFNYVAQAVAVNEYRGHILPLGRANVTDPHSWGAFPLESIMGSSEPETQTRIERGFIGAHSDIGGGFQDNQLSKVALAWMLEQAEKSGVKLASRPLSILSDPVLHDKSDAIRFGPPAIGSPLGRDADWNKEYDIPLATTEGTGAEDRKVRYLNGSTTTQRKMTDIGMTYAEAEQFISYDAQRKRSDNVTGTVDIGGYLAWLRLNGYGLSNLASQ
ncbi:MAG: hypothetical protein JWP36_791, partial [Paucimonas sp.]|nr:hypothetical protein [Paucimonas sp.]